MKVMGKQLAPLHWESCWKMGEVGTRDSGQQMRISVPSQSERKDIAEVRVCALTCKREEVERVEKIDKDCTFSAMVGTTNKMGIKGDEEEEGLERTRKRECE